MPDLPSESVDNTSEEQTIITQQDNNMEDEVEEMTEEQRYVS